MTTNINIKSLTFCVVRDINMFRASLLRLLKTTKPIKPSCLHTYIRVPVKERNKLPKALYGGRHMVTVLTGIQLDEIMMSFISTIFKNCGVPIDLDFLSIADVDDEENFMDILKVIKRNQVCLMGNLQGQSSPGIWKKNIIRNDLDLRVAVMHCKSYPAVPARIKDVDVVVVRQNTEAEYTMKEHEPKKGIVEHTKIITKQCTESVARFAFEFARRNKRKKITTVHQCPVLELSDGLFLQCCVDVAKDYPDIEHGDMEIHRCCQKLVVNPNQFDVILSPHLYGSIVAITLCGLTSGVSLFPFSNLGYEVAVFEPGFAYGVNEKEMDYANPIAYVNASVEMLSYLKLTSYAELIQSAVYKTINESRIHTRDLQGQATTKDIMDNLLSHLPKSMEVLDIKKD